MHLIYPSALSHPPDLEGCSDSESYLVSMDADGDLTQRVLAEGEDR